MDQLVVDAAETGPAAAAAATTTPAQLPPVIFVMLDWMNGDWGNPNYVFRYTNANGYEQVYKGHPEWGALGGWAAFKWRDLNPQPGVYDWSKTDKFIKDAQAMPVRLPDGTIIPKPVGIAVETWSMDETANQIGVNYTPDWVSTQCGGGITSCYDPDGSGPCKPFCIPKVRNPCWQAAFDQFIRAMGQHYDNNPAFKNLAFINIATGADEETVERKNFGSCTYSNANSPDFDNWVLHVMETYNEAFPHIPQFIQSTLHSIHYHAQEAASMPSKMTGVKVNGLEVNHPNGEVSFDGQLVGGISGFSMVHHNTIPTGYEPAHGNGIEGSYWFFMEGLFAHPHMFDVQIPNISDTYLAEQRTGFPIMGFVRRHLGRTVQNTPDVWVVLREAYGDTNCWKGSDGIYRCYGPHRGNFDYWLYQSDAAPQSKSYVLKGDRRQQIPQPARDHIYGYTSARRTDQATGNPMMSFNVDDGYLYAGQVPKAAGGSVTWTITATLVNTGTDTFSLEYKNYAGAVVRRQATKGAARGPANQWIDYTWTVDDAYFNNNMPGGMDFRINCNNDGDEILHRLIVSGSSSGGGSLPPTATHTPVVPTATATHTAVPPTQTPTRTTVPPTATALPTRTNTPVPSKTTVPPTVPPTVTPTLPAGGGSGGTVVLQQGLNGYNGETDAYITGWEPTRNTSQTANLAVRYDGIFNSLLRFDLSSIPPGVSVNRATLRLYMYYAEKTAPMTLQVYPVLKPWTDTQVTWNVASIGKLWGGAGVSDLAGDRTASPVAAQPVSLASQWYDFDVTSLVAQWLGNPASNYGVNLRGLGTQSNVHHWASANHPTASVRPQLVITFGGVSTTPTVEATATPIVPTAVPTSVPPTVVPPTVTALPTSTRTPLPTTPPTSTPLPTSTALPTVSPTSTPLPPPTATALPTATATTPSMGNRTVTLQQGANGYTGASDTYLTAWEPTRNSANTGNLAVRNDGNMSGLLRFDLDSIPSNAAVSKATLRLYVYYREKSAPMEMQLYPLLRPWIDAQATWKVASAGNPWGAPGAGDPIIDRAGDPIAVQPVAAAGAWYEFDVTEAVAGWCANPASNYGLNLRGVGPQSNVYHVASSNYPTTLVRPQLVVTYSIPAVGALAQVPAQLMSPTRPASALERVVIPDSGSSPAGQYVEFIASYSHPDGVRNLTWCLLHVGSAPDSSNSVQLMYNVQTDRLMLRDDSGTMWWGGLQPGEPGTIENGQVVVDCVRVSVSHSNPTTVEVRWVLSFKSAFRGEKSLFVGQRDVSTTIADWTTAGSWRID